MKNFILLTIFIINLSLVVASATDEQPEKVAYSELNEYLTKSVSSNDPIRNLEEASKWFETIKRSNPNDLSQFKRVHSAKQLQRLNDTLFYLTKLPHILADKSMCDHEGIENFAQLNNYLEKSRSIGSENMTYGRIERIVEHFAINWVDHCQGVLGYSPELPHIFKTSAYDEINRWLVKNVNSSDIKQNIGRLESLLTELEANQTTETIMMDSLRQLLAWNSILNERKCNSSIVYEIILKNDLATAGSACTNKLPPIRRIDKIVNYYLHEQAKSCLPFYERKFYALSQNLDVTTNRRVHKLFTTYASNFVLFKPDLPDIWLEMPFAFSSDLSNLNQAKLLNKDKLSPEELTTIFDFLRNTNIVPMWNELSMMYGQLVWLQSTQRFMNQETKGNPNATYLKQNEITGEYEVLEDKVREVFEEYILKPCESYIETYGKEVFPTLNYLLLGINETNPDLIDGCFVYSQCKFLNGKPIEEMLKELVDFMSYTLGRHSLKYKNHKYS